MKARLIVSRGLVLLLIGLFPLLAGCKPGGESGTNGVFKIGMSQCNRNEPWRVQMDADIQAAAEDPFKKTATTPSLKVLFKDAQNDTLAQRSHVEDFVSAGVDLLIISPKETDPLTKPVGEAYEAGIPVIVLDRAVKGEKFTTFIGADNVAIGHAAGKWLVEKLGGKGKVVELKGLMTSEPGKDRHRGFRDALAGTEIEVLFEADMEWLEDKARQEMESALDRFAEIDAVYGHNDPAAHGAYLAAKAAGREDDMLFVGIDALPHEGVEYVKQGILDATFEYPTGGAEAIDLARKILAGETVPRNIVLGSRVFTAENVEQGGQVLGK